MSKHHGVFNLGPHNTDDRDHTDSTDSYETDSHRVGEINGLLTQMRR